MNDILVCILKQGEAEALLLFDVVGWDGEKRSKCRSNYPRSTVCAARWCWCYVAIGLF